VHVFRPGRPPVVPDVAGSAETFRSKRVRSMITVSVAPSEKHRQIVSLLFSGRSEEELSSRTVELMEAVEEDRLSLDGLLVAESDGETVGVIFYYLHEDRTAFVWPPIVVGRVPVATVADALLQDLIKRIDAADAWLGQCLLASDDAIGREAMSRNGFTHLADLHYLERPLNRPLPSGRRIELESDVFHPENDAERLAKLLERSYQGTLDCPELNGMRTGIEAIDSHRVSGEFQPSQWKIYRHRNQDVGLILLNSHPDQNAWELVYMAILPEARGVGYGRDILLAALSDAKAAGQFSIILAVDGRNHPARRIYEDVGFSELEVRAVHARFGEIRKK